MNEIIKCKVRGLYKRDNIGNWIFF